MFNSNVLEGKTRSLLSNIIEVKFRNLAAFSAKDDDFRHFMLKNHGRTYQQNWLYVECESSADYLTYLLHK